MELKDRKQNDKINILVTDIEWFPLCRIKIFDMD